MEQLKLCSRPISSLPQTLLVFTIILPNFAEFVTGRFPSPMAIFSRKRQAIFPQKIYIFFCSKLLQKRLEYVSGIVAWGRPWVRFHLSSREQFLTRVCSLCGTKDRAAVSVKFLRNNLNQPAPCTAQNDKNERSKKMSNSPHQTQQNKEPRN